jgi:hypothetical protein
LARSAGKSKAQPDSFSFRFAGWHSAAPWDSVVLSGFGFIQEELEAERTAWCGERYTHQEHRKAVRGGHVPSSLVLVNVRGRAAAMVAS